MFREELGVEENYRPRSGAATRWTRATLLRRSRGEQPFRRRTRPQRHDVKPATSLSSRQHSTECAWPVACNAVETDDLAVDPALLRVRASAPRRRDDLAKGDVARDGEAGSLRTVAQAALERGSIERNDPAPFGETQ